LPAGIFLLVGTVYAGAGAGRIDIIDGQYRFEVARNLVDNQSLRVSDRYLWDAVPGVAAGAYSPYGVSGSIVSLPLLILAKAAGPPSVDRQQFFFSFTSALFGAATACILFLFYTTLGVARRSALLWTLVAAFATLAFPAATSVFDQTQHGFFVLAACYLAFLAGRRDSMRLAIAGGAALAILVNFQETYAILFPAIGIATLAPPGALPEQRRRSFERYLVFMFVGGLGLLMWAGLNNFRFGSLLFSGKGLNHPDPFANPLVGIAGLLLSPGKSIFIYSPPTVLALLGIYQLARRDPRLGQAIIATSGIYLVLISSLSFYGGDWCWGPRYFVAILPLFGLGFPFLRFDTASRRMGVRTLVLVGLGVQLLAISVDHHRFFYGLSLPRFFWAADRFFYFRQSALLARPGELFTTLRDGVPPEAVLFRPGPYPERLTYAVFGGWGHPELPPPLWMRRYRVFWLPRPWPLWMSTIPQKERPIDLTAAATVLVALGLAGAVAVRSGLSADEPRGAAFAPS
jgi:hypothetical protein